VVLCAKLLAEFSPHEQMLGRKVSVRFQVVRNKNLELYFHYDDECHINTVHTRVVK
jgi:hypothetical protein